MFLNTDGEALGELGLDLPLRVHHRGDAAVVELETVAELQRAKRHLHKLLGGARDDFELPVQRIRIVGLHLALFLAFDLNDRL